MTAIKHPSLKILLLLGGILLGGLMLRLLLTPYLSYRQDVYTYIYWGDALVNTGPKTFFVDNWVDYLPGYPYIVWGLSWIKSALHLTAEPQLMLLYKLPAILADIATAMLIYKLIDKSKKFSIRTLAVAAYVFSPAIFGNSALWGQTDAFTALAALATLYFVARKQPLLGGLALGIGTLVKLNTILIVPVIGLMLLKQTKITQKIATLTIVTLGIFLLGFLPFQNQPNFLHFIQDRIGVTTNQYPYTSLNAFNFWFLFDGSWKSDLDIFAFGLTKHTWGNLILITISVITLITLFAKLRKSPSHNSSFIIHNSAASAAILFTAAFLFLTRMHERHLFAALPFLLIAAALSRKWWVFYGWYSISYAINLLFGFQQGPSNPTLIPLSNTLVSFLSLGNLAMLVSMVSAGIPRLSLKFDLTRPSRHQPKALIIILILAFVIRFFRLGTPPAYHFDEVYHAFTAREMLHGNVKAWEWWNQSPPGVAYEWTHPPISKHFMVLGMELLGDNAWGWRFPGVIFGVANIYLVYLLAKTLFPPKKLITNHYSLITLPLLAAGLYSVESLTFVQSRIGMNDTYMLFFVLFSWYALLKKKYPASILSFGLALATKWSAVYIVPLLGLVIIAQNRRRLFRVPLLAIGYTLVALLVYLLSYAPFFASGHTWKQFTELQQQMYWYHTRLHASHDYSSPALSWPLLLRPVWYYVQYGQNTIANIYALGNPIIFWGGLVAVISSVVYLVSSILKKRLITNHYSLITVLVGYAVFFLPWVFSPRIMFLYHYLPAIPFMVILLAWALSQLYELHPKGEMVAVSYITLAVYTFIFFYPHLTALPVPVPLSYLFYWLSAWK